MKYYVANAFADRQFEENPAGVRLLMFPTFMSGTSCLLTFESQFFEYYFLSAFTR